MDHQAAVAGTTPERPARLRLIPPELIAGRVKSLREKVANRAFEIFRRRGREEDDALGDWYRAEAELFHSAHLDIREAGGVVLVRAEVPGFAAKDLQICVEPRRLIITGKRQTQDGQETRNVIYSEGCSDRIFRVLGLPVQVDANKASATLNNGILELAIPKVTMPSRTWIIAKTDWIVRADDYRAWKELLDVRELATTK
jgi:HSP20 family protein